MLKGYYKEDEQEVSIELLTNEETSEMCKAGLRGGVPCIGAARHAVANDPKAAIAQILRKEGSRELSPSSATT